MDTTLVSLDTDLPLMPAQAGPSTPMRFRCLPCKATLRGTGAAAPLCGSCRRPMTPHPIKTRAKRFQRARLKPNLELATHHLDILRHVDRRRMMTATQLVGLVASPRFAKGKSTPAHAPMSLKKIAEAMGQLFRAGYLDRPPYQMEHHRPGGGASDIAYALGNEGERVLREVAPGTKLAWTKKNNEAGRGFIRHTLATADFSSALRRAIETLPGHALIDHDHLLAALPAATRGSDQPWHWGPFKISVRTDKANTTFASSCIPDYGFRVKLPDDTFRSFMVEIDQGTMTLAPSYIRAHQSSIARKLVTYAAGYQTLRPKASAAGKGTSPLAQRFGIQDVRFLFVMPSENRVLATLEACHRHPDLKGLPHNLFLFTSREALADITAFPKDPRANQAQLLARFLASARRLLSHAWHCPADYELKRGKAHEQTVLTRKTNVPPRPLLPTPTTPGLVRL